MLPKYTIGLNRYVYGQELHGCYSLGEQHFRLVYGYFGATRELRAGMLTPSFRCNPFAVEAMHVFRNVVETILDGEVPGFKPVHLGFGQFP